MNYVAWIMAFFSLLATIDRIIGNKFGIGKEFERGIMLLGAMGLSMLGMIIISPYISELMEPLVAFVTQYTKFDPSIIPASILANDMGGAPLSRQLALNETMGDFSGLVVSSMMGCTISFTLPVALAIVKKEQHKEMLFGFLCGIVTIPIGCFFGGLVCKVPIVELVINLIPLVVFSLIIAIGLLKVPDLCIKVFSIFGRFISILIAIGLAIGIFKFLTGVEIIKGLISYEDAGMVILNASAVVSGAFPLIYIVSKIVEKPVKLLGDKLSINKHSAMGLVGTMATSMTTFDSIKDMDEKGVVLNSAFLISAAFVFAGHLAYTIAFNPKFLSAVIVGKLTAGLSALLLSIFMYNKIYAKKGL